MPRKSQPSELPATAYETLDSVADLERMATSGLSAHQRWIERATQALGRPRAVYAVMTAAVVWIGINAILATSGRAFDPPPFAYLDGIMSLGALLMTIFILTTENRTNLHDARRDQLDLQINLLNERKISKVIAMLEQLRRDSPAIPDRHDPEARELGRAADTGAIVQALEERTPPAV